MLWPSRSVALSCSRDYAVEPGGQADLVHKISLWEGSANLTSWLVGEGPPPCSFDGGPGGLGLQLWLKPQGPWLKSHQSVWELEAVILPL